MNPHVAFAIRNALAIILSTLLFCASAHADFSTEFLALDPIMKDKEPVAQFQALLPLTEQGNSTAQALIGMMYRDGKGVEADIEQAIDWSRKAVESGNPLAQYNLGIILLRGAEGVQADVPDAVELFRQSAEQGVDLAQANLGLLLAKGEGTAQDFVEARKWLLRAAEQGEPRAQRALGVLYANGDGGPRDYVEALTWWTIARTETNISRLKPLMTPEEIATAEQRAAAWKPQQTALSLGAALSR